MALGVNIVSEFDAKGIKKAIAEFKKLEGAGAKATYGLRTADAALGAGVKQIAKYGTILAGTAGVLGYSLVNAASAVEESMSKVRVVFGESSDAVVSFAETASTNIGISKQAALEAAGTYGNLFQAFGIGKQASQEMSTELVKLAADLASFNNASIDDALQALRSGLSGETEPLKRFGVALNDVRLKQEALNLGLYSGKGNLDIAAKSQAAFALIMKDTSLAQGDFARTSDGVANQQRILAAQFADVRAELGQALIPTFKTLMSFIAETVLPKVREFATVLGKEGVGGAIKYAAGEFVGFVSSGGKAKDIIFALTTAIVAFKLIVMAATIAQNLFNVSLLANPIGIVVAAIIAIGVALVAAYIRFEGFRKAVTYVINSVIHAWELMTNAIISGINIGIRGINAMIRAANLFGAGIETLDHLAHVSFGRIGNSAEAAGRQVVNVAKLIADAEARQSGKVKGTATTTTTPPVGSTAAATIKTAKEKMKEYIDSLKGVSNAERALARSGRDIIDARNDLTKATQRVSDAQAKFNQVTRGYGVDSKEAVEAMQKVQDAARKLRDANLSQQDAVRSLANAEKKLADLRNLRANPEDIASAERKLERSKYSTEESVFRVAEAEAELAKMRLDPEASAVEIRRAEISLAEAKLAVTDATISQRDAENDLQKMRALAATAEEIAEAERDLESAKYAVADATDAVRDAIIGQSTAQALYTEITEGAKEGSEAYKDALDDLLSAQEAERDASEKVTDQLWREYEATEALREAKEKLASVGSAVGGRIVARATEQFASSIPAAMTTPGGVTAPINGDTRSIEIVNNISAGLGADGRELANIIVDGLRGYERANGYIPITAQYAIAV